MQSYDLRINFFETLSVWSSLIIIDKWTLDMIYRYQSQIKGILSDGRTCNVFFAEYFVP